MTQNPFDALGGGGFDMNALLQQAQQMQQQLEQAQADLAQQTVDGTVAGGAVTVTANGVGELVGISIRTGEFDGSDPDDLSDLSDLIVAAYRDARAKSEALAGESLGPLTEGLGGGLGGGAAGGLGFPPPSLG
ncbi:YbaB/EbfC family nucleoid-associated protein [Nocardioides sp. J2M5]|uniref:YbaB/EbfC family nucleoid-associated protein n=1 Tax=Nocardioides palaemonis TaxID=2829810 RepID=UPI001BACDBB4|nr:YbaB/EbfC family nucleoid-associated protein [Nocardioides palaemonis]MBS2939931.1 YbaB/EbfC family nucleoid-associated protein [Nocardioides palaemonis]